MRAARLLAICAAGALACAGCAGARAAGCDRLRAELSQRGGAELLVGEGSAPLAGDDAAGAARQKALAALAGQIRVEVEAETRSQERSGAGAEQSLFESRITTRSSVALEGAEALGSCSEGGELFAYAGLHRGRFAEAALRRLRAAAGEASSRADRAAAELRAARPLAASALYRQAVAPASDADELASAIRAVGRRDPGSSWPSAAELRRRAAEAMGRVSVRLTVEPAQEGERLLQAGQACLAQAGIAAAAGGPTPDALLALRAAFDVALGPTQGLSIVRARLDGSLDAAPGAAPLAAATERVKGGGGSASEALEDARRRLASEALPALLDRLLRDAGWAVPACAASP
jgi:hypothetical protein